MNKSFSNFKERLMKKVKERSNLKKHLQIKIKKKERINEVKVGNMN